MKKKPLNQETRHLILQALLEHRFGKARKELDERPFKIGEIFYNEMLTKGEQRALARLPSHWVGKTGRESIRVNGRFAEVRFKTPEREPRHWTRGEESTVCLASGSSPTADAFVQLWADEEAYQQAYAAASSAARSTLATFKYVEDLIEQWPEVKKYIPADVKKAITTALAFPPAKLNEMLGLGKAVVA